jgi:guanylate kinase
MRLNKASEECSYRNQFDHIIVNDQLEKACKEAVSLVKDYLTR